MLIHNTRSKHIAYEGNNNHDNNNNTFLFKIYFTFQRNIKVLKTKGPALKKKKEKNCTLPPNMIHFPNNHIFPNIETEFEPERV